MNNNTDSVQTPFIEDDNYPYEMFTAMVNGKLAKDLTRGCILSLIEQGYHITIIRGKE